MSICIVVQHLPPAYSGAGLQALTLAREFKRQGHQVSLITRARDGVPAYESDEGFAVHRIQYAETTRPGLFQALRQLWGLARLFVKLRRDYTAVMFFGPDGGLPHAWVLLPLLHLLGKRTVTRMMLLDTTDPSGLRRRRFGQLRLMPYRLHHGAIALSTALRKSYTSVLGEHPGLALITNGVDVDRFHPIPESARVAQRAELGLEPDLFYCATVGRISYRKGIDTLIRAWAIIAKAQPNARLLLIGPERDQHRNVEDTRCLEEVHGLIAAHGMDSTIIWTGHTSVVERYMQCVDMFVFTSRREGCPNALVEAMASGLPIVSTIIPDITTDLITSGREGLLVDQEPEAVASAVLRLMTDAPYRQTLGEAAHTRAVNEFAIPATARRYLQVLRGA